MRPAMIQDGATLRGARPFVLLVEDERATRRATARLLRSRGLEIRTAATGGEALDLVHADTPGLVVLDLAIPAPDGLELCRRLRERWEAAEVPLLVLSGSRDVGSRLAALEAGANDFLVKPAEPAEFLSRVSNLLAQRGLHLDLRRERDRLDAAVRERTAELEQALAGLESSAERLRRSHEGTLLRLSAAAEFRDNETARHLDRMAAYSAILARAAGLPEARCVEIELAAPMHDVGKIGVPDSVLLKPGPLDDSEWEVMRSHPTMGHRLLADSESPLLSTAATIALTHHERMDGTGYPQGLRGADIPIEGRIVAVADVFDALTSARPYKPAFSLEKSERILREAAGHHLDGELVELFLGRLPEILACRARWPDGEVQR